MSLAEMAVFERREVVAAAEAALRKTDVFAPSEGIVVARNVEVGQTITTESETPLFLIATDLANVQVSIEVGETDAGKIEVGDAAVITVATLPGKTFPGVVSSVLRAEAPSKNGAMYGVTIETANPDQLLQLGMPATASIDVDSRDALTQ